MRSRDLHINSGIKRHLVVLLAFVALFIAMYPSLLSNWSRGYLGGSRGDAGIYVYAESVNSSRFFSPASEGFDLPIFYPWKRGLAFSDNFLMPALISRVMGLAIESQSVRYNLIVVSALCLNGFCAYLLALYASRSVRAAVFAGFVFMCFPYFSFHRGHPQLQFAFWLPLTLLGCLKFAESRSFGWACCIGAAVTGAFFCSVYYSMYCYLLAAVALFGCFLLRPRGWRVRDVGTLLAANTLWIVLLVPAAIPYMQTRSALGTNPFAVLRRHSPGLLSFVAAPWSEDLWARYTHDLSTMEGFLFFGIVPLTLCLAVTLECLCSIRHTENARSCPKALRCCVNGMALLSFAAIVRGAYFALQPGTRTIHHLAWIESETLWALLVGMSVILFLVGRASTKGPFSRQERSALLIFLGVFFVFATLGIKDGAQEAHRAPELYRWIVMLPGFDALRGLSRMGLVAVLIFVTLASIGLAEALNRRGVQGKPAAAWLLFVAVMLCSAAELHTRPETLPPIQGRPKIYASLAKLPTDEPLVTLPIRSAFRDGRGFMMLNSTYMLWARGIRNPMVNGFSGKVPPFQAAESDALDSFPSRRSLSLLGSLVGVRYVVTHPFFFAPSERRDFRAEAAQFPGEVETLTCDKHNNCVFRVQPVIDLRELPSRQLLVPPASAARVVQLELRQPCSPAEAHTGVVSFEIRPGGRSSTASQSVTLAPTREWQPATIRIPENSERVAPTAIAISTGDPDGVLIRNVSLRSEPGNNT